MCIYVCIFFKNKDSVSQQPIEEVGLGLRKLLSSWVVAQSTAFILQPTAAYCLPMQPNVLIHKMGIRLNQVMEHCADKVINNRKALWKEKMFCWCCALLV